MTISLTLPWPDRAITPNGHTSWQKRARLTASARNTAKVLTLEQLKGMKPKWQAAQLAWTLHPKTANFPDDNNAGGYVKAFCDGIADALGMNDATFRSTYQFGDPVKGGAVLVTVRGA
jgi:crossover junction endodeoxyribonuclease RusA